MMMMTMMIENRTLAQNTRARVQIALQVSDRKQTLYDVHATAASRSEATKCNWNWNMVNKWCASTTMYQSCLSAIHAVRWMAIYC